MVLQTLLGERVRGIPGNILLNRMLLSGRIGHQIMRLEVTTEKLDAPLPLRVGALATTTGVLVIWVNADLSGDDQWAALVVDQVKPDTAIVTRIVESPKEVGLLGPWQD